MNHSDKGIVIHKKYHCFIESIVPILKRMYTIIETTKGKPCLIYNNYRYLRDHIRNTSTYWCCENRGECPGRLTQKGCMSNNETPS